MAVSKDPGEDPCAWSARGRVVVGSESRKVGRALGTRVSWGQEAKDQIFSCPGIHSSLLCEVQDIKAEDPAPEWAEQSTRPLFRSC